MIQSAKGDDLTPRAAKFLSQEPGGGGRRERSERGVCRTNLDCIQDYELCVKGFCSNIEESTGLAAWEVGGIVIGSILLVNVAVF